MRRWAWILSAALLLALAAAPAGRAAAPKALTLMVYMCGSDLESQYGAATEDFQEMVAACAGNPDVSVLIMAGGSQSWTMGYDPEETQILLIDRRGQRTLESLPAMNMGDAESLRVLLEYGVEKRPAENYALILWDHGGGPLEGVCFDVLNQRDSLTLEELGRALEAGPFSGERRLSWIGFDACLMACLETAHVCAPYAEYMIASQETEPVSGWSYGFLADIHADYRAEETARRIVEAYPEGKDARQALTLSCTDLSGIGALEEAAERFFSRIGERMNADNFSKISRIRLRAKSFGRATSGFEYDLADLFTLADPYESALPAEAGALTAALEKTVVCTGGNQPDAHGLSIYSPYYNKSRYTDLWEKKFGELDMLPDYHQFVNLFSALWTEKSLAAWGKLTGRAEPRTEDRRQTVTLELSGEQAACFAEASCVVLEETGTEGVYVGVSLTPEARLEGSTVKADASFEALYAVDENGIAETEPITFKVVDGYYLVYATLEKYSMTITEEEAGTARQECTVKLQCRRNPETDELEIVNAIPSEKSQEELQLGRESVDLDSGRWPYISFLNLARETTKDFTGNLLPFFHWNSTSKEYQISLDVRDTEGNRLRGWDWILRGISAEEYERLGYHGIYEADNRRPWKLKFLPHRSSGRSLKAQMIVRDTQGNEWGSELIPLDNPAETDEAPLTGEAGSREGIRMEPMRIRAVNNGEEQGLLLQFRVSNEGDRDPGLALMGLTVNGKTCGGPPAIGNRTAAPDAEETVEFFVKAEELFPLEEKTLTAVSMIPVALMGIAGEEPRYFPRMRLETQLDLTGLRMPERPTGDPLAEYTVDGVEMELLALEETEDGRLEGLLHLENRTADAWRVFFAGYGQGGNRVHVCLNGEICPEAMEIHTMWDLEPGGEAYADFRILADEDHVFHAGGEEAEAYENPLKMLMEIDVFLEMCRGIEELADQETRVIPCLLALRKPIFLKTGFRIRYDPEDPSPGLKTEK